MIIGLTGPMGSGKGEIVNILKEKGFQYITLSLMVREEARRRGLNEEREILMDVGNSMRKEEGIGVLAKRALEKIMASGHDKWVIDGIRNPAEIVELKKGEDVHVVGVTADKEILISRILSRGRESDAKEREEIVHKIDREWGEGEPENGQQVGKCMDMVDFLIENNGTLQDLRNNFFNFAEGIKLNLN